MNHFIITLDPTVIQARLFELHSDLVKQVFLKLQEIVNRLEEERLRPVKIREMYRIINSIRYQNHNLRAVAAKTLRSLARNYDLYDLSADEDIFPMELSARSIMTSDKVIRLGRRYGNVNTKYPIPSINGYVHQVFVFKQDDNWVAELIINTITEENLAGCIRSRLEDDEDEDDDD